MIGEFETTFESYTTYENGDLNLSFRVLRNNAYSARQCIAEATALKLGGKERLKMELSEWKEKQAKEGKAGKADT